MRSTHVSVNLANVRHNIDELMRHVEPSTRYLAVVKANAYGHGMEEIARTALAHGANYLAVAFTEEGVRLREAGFTAPILLLGATDEAHMDDVIRFDLIPTVFTLDTLLALQRHAAALGRVCRFHFKVDTGMNRIGFTEEAAFVAALDALPACKNLVFEGMFTHFAVSEIDDPTFTLLQGERFRAFAALTHARGYRPLLHASNSGGALNYPSLQFDMVRGGISMYGYHPSGRAVPGVDLRPVLTWKTAVAHVKTIHAGDGVSYGLRFVADRDMRIATLPVGYGDGYKRCLSGVAEVLIHGRRAREIGTICMDQMMCDVSDIPDVEVGDEVVLIGSQGGETITADDMAAWADTISYEILLSIDDRVPRVFIEE